jgi:Tfp pilus assembly protein PilX
MQATKRNLAGNQSGSALLLALVVTLVLASMAGAMMAVSGAFKQEAVVATDESRALYVAEAGLSEGIALVQAGAPGNFGSVGAPVPFGDGGYWGTVQDNGDDSMTVTAFSQVSGRSRGVEAVMVLDQLDIYDTALFAGNTGGDPLYDMEFGGKGVQADEINGNIYSGGNVVITGDAEINGTIKASGAVSGGEGTTGSVPIPDIPGMKYETNHDFNVAAMFAGASLKSHTGLGGTAWQMPESSPAHIFRKNPSDRTADTSKTPKHDYFLEDPYEAVNTAAGTTVAKSTHITLSGQDGNPGVNGSAKVYYIDGNLWIHNKNIFSFSMFNSKTDPVQVTFVVKGNIYFSDNILYQDGAEDGVAFISIKDDKVHDSGNIYFGDPTFGTLEHMDAFMYAENNFYDNNLSASGSATVTVNGNMTAGNQVSINRDVGTQHSKLTVNFDDRISTGAITLPGLPTANNEGAPWKIASWREVAAP